MQLCSSGGISHESELPPGDKFATAVHFLRSDGIGPESRMACNNGCFEDLRFPREIAISPESRLLLDCTFRRLTQLPTAAEILPDSWIWYKNETKSWAHLPNANGIAPSSYLFRLKPLINGYAHTHTHTNWKAMKFVPIVDALTSMHTYTSNTRPSISLNGTSQIHACKKSHIFTSQVLETLTEECNNLNVTSRHECKRKVRRNKCKILFALRHAGWCDGTVAGAAMQATSQPQRTKLFALSLLFYVGRPVCKKRFE